MSFLRMRCAALALALTTAACGGSTETIEPPNPNPPSPTTGRVSIHLTTSVPTIWAGAIYGRSGTASSRRIDFTGQDGRCASAFASTTCFYDVKIGDTVTLAAMEALAEPVISAYAAVSSPDDPRTIEAQFVSWSSPCISRERGVCTFRVTGNQTVTAHFKSLTLTRFFFSGLNPWQLTVNAPASLGLTSVNPPVTGNIRQGYGSPLAVVGGVPFRRCMAGDPAGRCVIVLTPDNSTIKMQIYPPDGPAPLGTLGPLAFVGWGGACAGSPGADQAGLGASCTLSSGTDQIAIARWQYYQCPNGVNEGFGGYKYVQDPLRPDGCTLRP